MYIARKKQNGEIVFEKVKPYKIGTVMRILEKKDFIKKLKLRKKKK